MVYIRNMLIITAFSFIVSACGGGNTTIADNAATSTGTGGGNTGSGTSTGNSSSTGNITLKWTAPTTFANGSAISLSDISGYKLFYGSSATNTPNVINISDSTAIQYTVSLSSGTYYFVICAVDSSGHQGLMSVAIQKTI